MSRTAWTALCAIGAVAMIAMTAVSAVLGGCESTVELANGNNAFMKCHWTFLADAFVGAIGVVVAIMAMTCKDQSGRRASGVALIAVALVGACVPASPGIGLCSEPSMHCHMTALIVWCICAVAVIVGVIQIVKSKPGNLPGR